MKRQQETGDLLIFGKGTYMKKQMIYRLLQAVFAVVINIYLIYWVSNQKTSAFSMQAIQRNQMLDAFIVILIIMTIVEISWILLRYWQAYIGRYTSIAVHENIIEGKFGTGFMGLLVKEIDLYYNTITNVDTIKGGLVIHTQGVKYTCYAENSEKIRNQIMKIRND